MAAAAMSNYSDQLDDDFDDDFEDDYYQDEELEEEEEEEEEEIIDDEADAELAGVNYEEGKELLVGRIRMHTLTARIRKHTPWFFQPDAW